jgi:hypothetical protein
VLLTKQVRFFRCCLLVYNFEITSCKDSIWSRLVSYNQHHTAQETHRKEAFHFHPGLMIAQSQTPSTSPILISQYLSDLLCRPPTMTICRDSLAWDEGMKPYIISSSFIRIFYIFQRLVSFHIMRCIYACDSNGQKESIIIAMYSARCADHKLTNSSMLQGFNTKPPPCGLHGVPVRVYHIFFLIK